MSDFLLSIGKSVLMFWGLSGLFLVHGLVIIFLILINVKQFKQSAFKLFLQVLWIPIISIWLSINAVEIDGIYLGGYIGDYLKNFLVKYYTIDSLELFFDLSVILLCITAKRFFVIRYLFKTIYLACKLMLFAINLTFKLCLNSISGLISLFGKKPKKQSNIYMEQDTFWSDLFEVQKVDLRMVPTQELPQD